MDKFPTIPITATYTQVDSKPTMPPPSTDFGQTVLAAGVGFAAIGAVVIKLIERFGTNAIESRQAKVQQELEQERSMSEFYIKQANRDAETINQVLRTLLTNNLNGAEQSRDMYYKLLTQYEELSANSQKLSDRLGAIESSLKDVFAVLSMKERNKS